MRAEIKKVHQTVRTTTVYVTHDQVEAMTLADRVVVMNGGIIEQVGPPQELYHFPKTRFVAGFIGSPGMNFFPVQVGDGVVRLEDGQVLGLPAEKAARYARYRETADAAGDQAGASDGGRAVPGVRRCRLRVDVVEPMGMETMVHFRLGETTVGLGGATYTARIPPETRARPGETLPLQADMNQMHLLEPDTGRVV